MLNSYTALYYTVHYEVIAVTLCPLKLDLALSSNGPYCITLCSVMKLRHSIQSTAVHCTELFSLQDRVGLRLYISVATEHMGSHQEKSTILVKCQSQKWPWHPPPLKLKQYSSIRTKAVQLFFFSRFSLTVIQCQSCHITVILYQSGHLTVWLSYCASFIIWPSDNNTVPVLSSDSITVIQCQFCNITVWTSYNASLVIW